MSLFFIMAFIFEITGDNYVVGNLLFVKNESAINSVITGFYSDSAIPV